MPFNNCTVRSDELEEAVWYEMQTVLDDPRRVAAEHKWRTAAARLATLRAACTCLVARSPACDAASTS